MKVKDLVNAMTPAFVSTTVCYSISMCTCVFFFSFYVSVECFPVPISAACYQGSPVLAWNRKESHWSEKECSEQRRRGPWWYITTYYSAARFAIFYLLAVSFVTRCHHIWSFKTLHASAYDQLLFVPRSKISGSFRSFLQSSLVIPFFFFSWVPRSSFCCSHLYDWSSQLPSLLRCLYIHWFLVSSFQEPTCHSLCDLIALTVP